MIAGTLVLWAIIILANAFKESNYKLLYLVPIMLVAGVLFHAATLFLIPLVLIYGVVLALKERRNIKLNRRDIVFALASVIFSLAIYMYHNSFGIKTSFGATFVLTGSGIFGLDSDQLHDYLLKYFNQLTLMGFLSHKYEQLITLIWLPYKEVFFEKDIISRLRVAEFYSALPAILIFTPAVIFIKGLQNKTPAK
jgi:hypothetical protein